MWLPHPPINNSFPWVEGSLALILILATLVRLATLAHLATLAPLATPATHVILATWPHCPRWRRCPTDHSSLSILLSLKLHPEGSSCLSFQPNLFSLLLILKLHPEGSFSFSSNRTPFRCPWSSNLQETLDLPSSRASSASCWSCSSILKEAVALPSNRTFSISCRSRLHPYNSLSSFHPSDRVSSYDFLNYKLNS